MEIFLIIRTFRVGRVLDLTQKPLRGAFHSSLKMTIFSIFIFKVARFNGSRFMFFYNVHVTLDLRDDRHRVDFPYLQIRRMERCQKGVGRRHSRFGIDNRPIQFTKG